MKKIKLLFCITLIAFMFNSCKDESISEPADNTFSFNGLSYSVAQTLVSYVGDGIMYLSIYSNKDDHSALSLGILLTGCTSTNIPLGEYTLDESGKISTMKNMTFFANNAIGDLDYASKTSGKITIKKTGNVYEFLFDYNTDKGKTLGKAKGEFAIDKMYDYFIYKGTEYQVNYMSRNTANPDAAILWLSSSATGDANQPYLAITMNHAFNNSFEAGAYTFKTGTRTFIGSAYLNAVPTAFTGGTLAIVKTQKTSSVSYTGKFVFTTADGTGEALFLGAEWATKKAGNSTVHDKILSIQDKIELFNNIK